MHSVYSQMACIISSDACSTGKNKEDSNFSCQNYNYITGELKVSSYKGIWSVQDQELMFAKYYRCLDVGAQPISQGYRENNK